MDVRQGNEFRESLRFLLDLPDDPEMADSGCLIFVRTVHDGRGGGYAEAMCFPDDANPGICIDLLRADDTSHPIVENFGSGTAEGIQSRIFHPFQHLTGGPAALFGGICHFHRVARMNVDVRCTFSYPGYDIDVRTGVEIRMQTA